MAPPLQFFSKLFKRNPGMRDEKLSGYLFILPIVILFLTFIIYPLVYNFLISLYKWNGVSKSKDFVGIKNYFLFLTNPVFYRILKNFLIFGLSTILVQAFFGLVFASLILRRLPLSNMYRVIFYIPVIATPAIVGNIFSKILETNRGYLNETLRALHLDFLTQQWLADPKWALACITVINIWQWTGYSMLLYYANMLNIPSEIYEAATIDGAGETRQFFRITFPLLRSSHFSLFVLGALGALKCFDLPYVLTKGGPNYATEFFSTYIYKKSFDLFQQGQSSAIVMVMFVLAVVITAAQMKLYTMNDKNRELAA